MEKGNNRKSIVSFFSVLILILFWILFFKSKFLYQELKENLIQETVITALSIIAVTPPVAASVWIYREYMRN